MILKRLKPSATGSLGPDFLAGTVGFDATKHEADFDRDIDLAPLRRVLAESRERHRDVKAPKSDAWLAPRVHATLRLTRREAADRQIWSWLGVVAFPGYVRWRWGTPAALDRFTGGDTKQALARLWWGAELTRNGTSYEPTVAAFSAQDIPNTWLRLDALHHRPTALAGLRVMSQLRSGPLPDGKRAKATKKINLLSTALNLALTTTVLDDLVPWPGDDGEATRAWIREAPDETLMLDKLPGGPLEEPVPEPAIARAEELVRRIAEEAGLFVPAGADAPTLEDEIAADES